MVHRQEVQMKFEDIFASSRTANTSTPRSRGAGGVALHIADLERRVGDCERNIVDVVAESRECSERQFVELRSFASDARASMLRDENRLEHADAALEARLRRMQTDASEAVQAVEVSGERRLQSIEVASE